MNDKFHMSVDENIFLAKKILVGSVYNAAKLEGVDATFPETEAILNGVNAPGVKLDDIQTVLNLRDAWRDLLAAVKTAKIDLQFIKQINANVSRNESLAWGKLRTGKVGIAGTNHKPDMPDEKTAQTAITKILSDKTRSMTERAIDLMLFIMRGQLFWDGNKRTAALAANAVLIQNGAGVLSVAEGDIVEFNSLLKQYYDTGRGDELKEFLYDKTIIDFSSQTARQDEPLNEPENEPLNSTEIKVLAAISNNPFITYDELAEAVGKSRATVQRTVAELKSRDIINRRGSDKKGHWQIAQEK
jgi:Fic family protein